MLKLNHTNHLQTDMRTHCSYNISFMQHNHAADLIWPLQCPQRGIRPPVTGAVKTPLPLRGAVVPAMLPPLGGAAPPAGDGAIPNPDGEGSETGGGAAAAATAKERVLLRLKRGAGGGKVCFAGIEVKGGNGDEGLCKSTGAGGGKVCLTGIVDSVGRGEIGRAGTMAGASLGKGMGICCFGAKTCVTFGSCGGGKVGFEFGGATSGGGGC
jgi:hypothetical protein